MSEMTISNAAAKPAETSHKKLTLKNIIGYGFGETGSQFSWTLISSYLTVFYTDVVGLTPAIIAGIMLIARIWDAVNDPMFGSIAENYTHTKWGRFRPYILFGAPFLALFNCLTFLNLDISNSAKTIWCAVTYILCGMAYTAVSISVGSLANCMTESNKERVILNSSRNIMGNLAGLLISAITMPIILFFGSGKANSPRGYFVAALIMSLISVPCFIICFATTKEVIGGSKPVQKKEKGALWKSIIDVFKDHDCAVIIIAMILVLTAVMGRVGIMAYYFLYIFKNPAIIAGCATALTLGMILPGFYAPFLLNRIDKKWVGVGACIAMALSCVAFYWAGETLASTPVLIAIHFIYGASNAAAIVTFSLMGEVIDDKWIRTGKRNDGAVYSMVSFGTKLGNAIGGSIGILALGAVGFVANTDLSAPVLSNMDKVINFGPAAIYLMAAVAFAMVRMTNKKGVENEAKVKELMAQSQTAED